MQSRTELFRVERGMFRGNTDVAADGSVSVETFLQCNLTEPAGYPKGLKDKT